MSKIFKKGEFWTILLIFLAFLFIYRDVIVKGRIIFPSNFLATFYSPWATYKYPGYPNGIPHKPIGGNDNIRMFYPYRTFINESFAKKEFPLWNPYNFSGSPLIANFQSAVFYPLNIIYFFLPQIYAWSIMTLIQPILGTFFMYLYLRRFIKEKLAVFLGAFSFGFSGFIIAWSQENAVVGQTALWLPLVLFSIEKLIFTFNLKSSILPIVSLSMSIFAGHLQISFYIYCIALVYGIFRIKQLYWNNRIRSSLIIGVLLYLGIISTSFFITAIQLLPSIEAFGLSTRSSTSIESVIETYLLPVRYFLKVLAPDIFGNPATYNYFGQGFYHETVFYIGIIPLVFAILTMIKLRENKMIQFFTWITIISFISGVKSPLTDWFYRLPIPLISTFTPSRIFFVTSASLCILSSFGFAYWLKIGTTKIRNILYTIITSMILILILFVGYSILSSIITDNSIIQFVNQIILPHSHVSLLNAKVSGRIIILPLFMLVSLIFMILIQPKIKSAKILIIFIFCFGQFYFLSKYTVIGNPDFLYPEHFVFSDIQKYQKPRDRFLTFGSPILGDIGLVKHVYSPDGIDPVFPKRYGQLIYAAKNNGQFSENYPPRIEVCLSEYAENENIISNNHRYKLISLLGVTRIYNYEKNYRDSRLLNYIFPSYMFKPLWKNDNWQVYENIQAYPIAFFVDNFLVEKDQQKIINLIFDNNIDLRKTVILEEYPNLTYNKIHLSDGAIKDVSLQIYQPQHIEFEVNTDSDRLFFLSDNYYPGWHAEVDKKPTKIYRANFTFRAVLVPKGKHTIIFSFKPLSFSVGAILSSITIISIISIALINLKFANLPFLRHPK